MKKPPSRITSRLATLVRAGTLPGAHPATVAAVDRLRQSLDAAAAAVAAGEFSRHEAREHCRRAVRQFKTELSVGEGLAAARAGRALQKAREMASRVKGFFAAASPFDLKRAERLLDSWPAGHVVDALAAAESGDVVTLLALGLRDGSGSVEKQLAAVYAPTDFHEVLKNGHGLTELQMQRLAERAAEELLAVDEPWAPAGPDVAARAALEAANGGTMATVYGESEVALPSDLPSWLRSLFKLQVADPEAAQPAPAALPEQSTGATLDSFTQMSEANRGTGV